MKDDIRQELHGLLGSLVNRTITPEQHARLETMLSDDAEARRIYWQYLNIDFQLAQWQKSEPGPEPIEELLRQAEPSQRHDRSRFPRTWRYALVTAATILCAVLLLHRSFTEPSRDGGDSVETVQSSVPPQPSVTTATSDYVATLARASQCVWEGRARSWREGSRLPPGPVRLKQGVAELLFDGGAILVLEGPARLTIESPMSATLISGKVVMRSDLVAGEFALHAASTTFVDLGTEYGLAIGPSGEVELHVFEGIVERRLHDAGTVAAPSAQVVAGEAKCFADDPGLDGTPVPLDADRFTRRVPVREFATDDIAEGILAYEGFNYATGTLPAPGVEYGGFGWAGPWKKWDGVPAITLGSNADTGESATGGLAIQQPGRGHIGRVLAEPLRLDRNAVYYISFLFRQDGFVDPADDGLHHRLHLTLVSSDRVQPIEEKLRFGVVKSEFMFGVLGGDRTLVHLPLEKGATYLMVVKIAARRAQPDQLLAVIYRQGQAVGIEEPAGWTMVSRPADTDLVFHELGVNFEMLTDSTGECRQSIDEIRVGTTWRSVTAPLPPSHSAPSP